jgi:hypothetical protein
MSKLELALGIAASVLDLALAALLLFRKLGKRFRFFLIYLLCSGVGDCLTLWMAGSRRWVFILTWAIQALYGLLTLLVITDIFEAVVRFVYAKLGWLGFLIALVMFAAIDYLFWRPVHEFFGSSFLGRLVSNISAFQFAVYGIAFGIFLVSAWLRIRHGIWSNRSLAVLAGFGVIGLSRLLSFFALVIYGTRFGAEFQFVRSLVFIGATLFWIVFFVQDEEVSRAGADPENLRKLLELVNQRIEMTVRVAERFGLPFRLRRK